MRFFSKVGGQKKHTGGLIKGKKRKKLVNLHVIGIVGQSAPPIDAGGRVVPHIKWGRAAPAPYKYFKVGQSGTGHHFRL